MGTTEAFMSSFGTNDNGHCCDDGLMSGYKLFRISKKIIYCWMSE